MYKLFKISLVSFLLFISLTIFAYADNSFCQESGHIYGDVIQTNYVDSTCTKAGYYYEEIYCEECGELLSKTKVTVVKKAHAYNKVITPATFKSDGLEENKCSVCGIIKSSKVIYKIGEVKLNETSCVYDGYYHDPYVICKDSQGNSILNYCTYNDIWEYKAGQYTTTVTFSGKYSGSKKLTYNIIPSKVSGVTKSKIHADSVYLNWNSISGVSLYEVYESLDGQTWKKNCESTKTSVKVTELKKDTSYQFKVRAVAKSGKGSFSSVVKIKTLKSNADIIYFTLKLGDGTTKKYEVDNKDYMHAYETAYTYASKHASAESPITIKLPKCTIDYIALFNNVYYDLTAGVNVKSTVYYTTADKGKYTGLTNVKIKGGNFSLTSGNKPIMRFAHAQKIVLDSCNFTYGGTNHMVEIAACKNISFLNCKFTGTGTDVKKSGYEALQLDILDKGYHFTNAEPYDGTMSDTVIVKNCTFTNVSRGVGTRNLFPGYYQKNIQIVNNTFNGIEATAIVLTGAINSKITGNKISKSGEGICFYEMTGDGNLKNVTIYNTKGKINTDCKSEISNNTITVQKTGLISKPTGIYIGGNKVTTSKTKKFPAGDYYVGNIKVNSNNVTTPMFGIRFFDVKKSSMSGNTIKASAAAQNAIYLGVQSNSNAIKSNKISGKFDAGIVINASDSNTISSNTITSPVYYGINMISNCKLNSANSNTITGSGASGISVVSSTCDSISSNTIKNAGAHGITIQNKSTVNIIQKNKIERQKAKTVYIDSTSKVKKNL